MSSGTGVKTRHKAYTDYAKKWKKCRDVVAGEDAIHAAGTEYLSALKDQDPLEYAAYVNRTPFYNATWRTIAGFIGMMFRKPPSLEVPKSIEELLKDVTLSGVTFETFVKDTATEDLEVSRVGLLVDYPSQAVDGEGKPIRLTKAQAEALGMRPTMQQYKAESIINWKFGRINNKTVLTQVRLLELATVEIDEFNTEEESRIRVLDLVQEGNAWRYRVRIFKEEDETQIGGEVFPQMNGKPLDFIPFYFIGPDGTDGTLDDPILIDLVNLNLKHYSVSADYEHGCHMTGLPTPVVSGYATQYDQQGAPIQASFYIGSTTAWVFPDANAKAEFLEFTGQGLQALENNLNRKESQMAAIGARMLAPEKSGVEAAETLAMRHNGENSILAAIAIAVSEGIEKALKVFVEWAGENPANVKFEISREFIPVIADSALITQLMALVQGGHLDEESLFDWLKRADLVKHDLTFKDMQGRIDAMPPPAPIGHNGGPTLDDGELDENGNPVKKPVKEPKPSGE